jgi:hypothetical protein
MELVEAQQARLARQLVGDGRDHVLVAQARLAPLMQRVMHFQHEGMKMHPPLGLDRGAFEKKIHQHGLAATHGAEKIKALGGLRLAPRGKAEALAPGLRTKAVRAIILEGVMQRLQLFGCQFLRRVVAQPAALAHVAIAGQRPIQHR